MGKIKKNKHVKTVDSMMSNVVKLGMLSFKLEEDRENQICGQAGKMMLVSLIYLVMLCISVIALASGGVVKETRLLFTGIISCLPMVISLVLSILAQWRFSYDTTRDIDTFYNSVVQYGKFCASQPKFDWQWAQRISQLHPSKKENDDNRVHLLIASMISFLASIFLTICSVAGLLYAMWC